MKGKIVDLSKFNKEWLFREFAGRRLENFFGRHVFKDAKDYQAQTPEIYPLGKLQYSDDYGGMSGDKLWITTDGSIRVVVSSDGTIKRVFETY